MLASGWVGGAEPLLPGTDVRAAETFSFGWIPRFQRDKQTAVRRHDDGSRFDLESFLFAEDGGQPAFHLRPKWKPCVEQAAVIRDPDHGFVKVEIEPVEFA